MVRETAEFLAALSKAKAESVPENVLDEVRRAVFFATKVFLIRVIHGITSPSSVKDGF